jgi:hypothetical protein
LRQLSPLDFQQLQALDSNAFVGDIGAGRANNDDMIGGTSSREQGVERVIGVDVF